MKVELPVCGESAESLSFLEQEAAAAAYKRLETETSDWSSRQSRRPLCPLPPFKRRARGRISAGDLAWSFVLDIKYYTGCSSYDLLNPPPASPAARPPRPRETRMFFIVQPLIVFRKYNIILKSEQY